MTLGPATTNPTNPQRGAQFTPGQSGNPAGRPKGSRNKVTLAIEALMEGEAEDITRKAIEAAKAGDLTAIKMVLDRVAPAPKERTVRFDLPTINSASDLPAAVLSIMGHVAAGELGPSEGAQVVSLLEQYRRHAETADLSERIAKLEDARARKS